MTDRSLFNDNQTADWQSVPTRYVQAAGARFAYRRLGPDAGAPPVVLLNHWAANLDNFDPRIVEGLAGDRPVYAIDYRGIGKSDGKAPLTIKDWRPASIRDSSFALVRFSMPRRIPVTCCAP